MSAKRASKKATIKQWHSWRPGWMSTSLVLAVILMGAVFILTWLYNPKYLNVASITGVSASTTFSCTDSTIAHPLVHYKGNIIADTTDKCNHDWKANYHLSYITSDDKSYTATCGANQHDCAATVPSSGYYAADSKHTSTYTFNINKTNSCAYRWVLQWNMRDRAYHYSKYHSYILPTCNG